jgi:predicted nucleic acid-binding Zn ribbon protein
MEPDRRCAKCGQAIPWGETDCPLCSERLGYFWLQRRDTFLILVFVLIILLFVITGYAVRRYHAVERGLAQDWYSRGEQALKASHAGAALADFRNALA